MTRIASLLLLSTLALPAWAADLAEPVATLAKARAWHGTAVFYGGEYTDVRAAWDRLAAEATDEELLGWVVDHPAAGVRYGAFRVLVERDLHDRIPDIALGDRASVEVCPGGCMCATDSVGARLATLRAGKTPDPPTGSLQRLEAADSSL
ncbi:MAG: hypothetical protein H6737_28200 [Alphaproteobacteria bacterium]|nr:hypothetical protein [Alphaproteobacteria bacterium]